MIRLKRIYERAADDDGLRILVERLWPRGISKANAKLDLWAKDVAPTDALRRWHRHQPQRWPEFRERYRRELESNEKAVSELKAMVLGRRATFVFAAAEPEHNSAAVLKEFLGE